MTTKTASWRGIGFALLGLIALMTNPAWSAQPEPKETTIIVKKIDLDECEPVKIRAKIMEVRPDRGTIVVLEREIRDMDVEDGAGRIKTSRLGITGKPESFDSFRAGQYVLVKGFRHPDGYIAASLIQKIEKPVEKRTNYKPVESIKKGSR
ncbi:MAG: hypothetical protein HY895_17215 [Deltaproteobacteria bacterium]|nr:hypothetical protein [Deltaproteobacteria bacterium]